MTLLLLMLMLFAANYYCTSVSCAAALVAHLCSNLLSFALKRHRLSKCRHKTWIHTAHPHTHTHMAVGRGRPGGKVRSTLVSSHAAMTVCTWLWLWFWLGFGFRTRLSLACTVSVCPVLCCPGKGCAPGQLHVSFGANVKVWAAHVARTASSWRCHVADTPPTVPSLSACTARPTATTAQLHLEHNHSRN